MYEVAKSVIEALDFWRSQARLTLGVMPPALTLASILTVESHRYLTARREQRIVNRALRRYVAQVNNSLWGPVAGRARHAA